MTDFTKEELNEAFLSQQSTYRTLEEADEVLAKLQEVEKERTEEEETEEAIATYEEMVWISMLENYEYNQ